MHTTVQRIVTNKQIKLGKNSQLSVALVFVKMEIDASTNNREEHSWRFQFFEVFSKMVDDQFHRLMERQVKNEHSWVILPVKLRFPQEENFAQSLRGRRFEICGRVDSREQRLVFGEERVWIHTSSYRCTER
ncbi:hypothetical protein HYC85_030832 [Camellia sinensis]|uniref:Uncharacterized protein n=1 Tax=Camellia sinensis TaxID=4442 RepID=A0A7J7G3R5_CAMSI|nr:hypothetical protein HYC85_030832 [Camellia sinensis]